MSANSIVTIVTKSTNTAPWFSYSNTQIFTPTDIVNVVQPYRDYVNALPGFISSSLSNIDSLNQQSVIYFDTFDNAQNGYNKLFGADKIVVANNRYALMYSKLQEYNNTSPIQVTFSSNTTIQIS
jgi:hypothetical protein